MYWESLHDPLKQCLLRLLDRNPNAAVLICGVRRWKSDNAFYRALGKLKGVRCECVFEKVARVEKVGRGGEDDLFGLDEGETREERSVMRIYCVEREKEEQEEQEGGG